MALLPTEFFLVDLDVVGRVSADHDAVLAVLVDGQDVPQRLQPMLLDFEGVGAYKLLAHLYIYKG